MPIFSGSKRGHHFATSLGCLPDSQLLTTVQRREVTAIMDKTSGQVRISKPGMTEVSITSDSGIDSGAPPIGDKRKRGFELTREHGIKFAKTFETLEREQKIAILEDLKESALHKELRVIPRDFDEAQEEQEGSFLNDFDKTNDAFVCTQFWDMIRGKPAHVRNACFRMLLVGGYYGMRMDFQATEELWEAIRTLEPIQQYVSKMRLSDEEKIIAGVLHQAISRSNEKFDVESNTKWISSAPDGSTEEFLQDSFERWNGNDHVSSSFKNVVWKAINYRRHWPFERDPEDMQKYRLDKFYGKEPSRFKRNIGYVLKIWGQDNMSTALKKFAGIESFTNRMEILEKYYKYFAAVESNMWGKPAPNQQGLTHILREAKKVFAN